VIARIKIKADKPVERVILRRWTRSGTGLSPSYGFAPLGAALVAEEGVRTLEELWWLEEKTSR
jgi:hypothetical protein